MKKRNIFSRLVISIFKFEFKETLEDILFRKRLENEPESFLICPECESTDWKFPNPLKPRQGGINIYQLVNNYYECKECSYIGVFFSVNKKPKFTKSKPFEEDKIIKDYRLMYNLLCIFSIFIIGGLYSVMLIGWLKKSWTTQVKTNKMRTLSNGDTE